MNATIKNLFKLAITVTIFVGLFAEFGGGPVEVDRAALLDSSALSQANPEMPGTVGKWKARFKGTALPAPTAPLNFDAICNVAAERTVFVRSAGQNVPLKALRHCEEDRFATVMASAEGALTPLAAATGSTVWVVSSGFQLVPMDMADLWREIKSLEIAVFLPWFLFAIGIKLIGIFANIYRWKILLDGQALHFGYAWLVNSYFVGRFWGIVTPSTMGLDGWRLYDTIRLSRRPVECTTALAVERVIGLVGLLAVILCFMPFADLGGRDLADLVKAMALPLAAAVFFGVLFLLRPGWFAGIARVAPAKIRKFIETAIRSATAYSDRRGVLLLALGCAVFGQLTTMFMYFANAMAFQVEGVTMTQVLYASAVMTLGTFLAPSASGEGVRELVFVALLSGRTSAAKAFLIGHLGFWIEKLPLSIPGGFIYLRAPAAYAKITRADLDRLIDETKKDGPDT